MNITLKSIISAGFAFLVGMTALNSTVNATTPDGETPANEDVCNILTADGVTKGLYGLCVAYCEAQDLDILGDKNPPSDRILTNYNKKKLATDPEMPCLSAPCPCWDTGDVFGNTSTQVYGILGTPGIKTCTLVEPFYQIENQVENINGVAQRANIHKERLICRYLDRTGIDGTISYRFNVTPEEADACQTQVVTACSGL